jgi:Snf7
MPLQIRRVRRTICEGIIGLESGVAELTRALFVIDGTSPLVSHSISTLLLLCLRTTASPAATAALKRKHELEKQRDQLEGTRMTLETQANAIESAHFNAQTVVAMRQGAQVLKSIHKQFDVDKVEDTVEDIREQMEITQQIAHAISDPFNVGMEGLDEVRVNRLYSVSICLFC